MDRQLLNAIKQGNKRDKGNRLYETATGYTTAAVKIAKDWLQALKDIVANDADALKIIAEFDERIDAEVAKGDTSDIYAQIRQQMPDTTDLGLIAANMQSIESWLQQVGGKSMKLGEADELSEMPDSTDVKNADTAASTPDDPGSVDNGGDGSADEGVNLGQIAAGIGKAAQGIRKHKKAICSTANSVGQIGSAVHSAVSACKGQNSAKVKAGPRMQHANQGVNEALPLLAAPLAVAGKAAAGIGKVAAGAGKAVAKGVGNAAKGVGNAVKNTAQNVGKSMNNMGAQQGGGNQGNAPSQPTAQAGGGAVPGGVPGGTPPKKPGIGSAINNGVNNVAQGVGNAAGSMVPQPRQMEALGNGGSFVTAVRKSSRINTSGDAPDIKKTSVNYTDKDALDPTNTNQHGYVGDEIVEQYYTDENGDLFYIVENGDAYYVDENYDLIEDDYLGNVFDGDIELFEEDDEEGVYPHELFEDEDGDLVFYGEDGGLYYASNEDINIYYNGQQAQVDDGSGGEQVDPNTMPQDPNAVDPNAGGAVDPNAQQAPQEPMDVELQNHGPAGEVTGVVINVAGKTITVDSSGAVNEQPAGAQQAQPQQGAVQEGKTAADALLSLFAEDNHDISDVKRKKPVTAIGGEFPDGIDYIDSSTLTAMNSGKDINGKKKLNEDYGNEPYRLFRDTDGDVVYFNEEGYLLYASDDEREMFEANGDYDHITVPAGLGKSLRAPAGRMATDQFEADMMDSNGQKSVSTPTTPDGYYELGNKDFNGSPKSAKDVKHKLYENISVNALNRPGVFAKMTRQTNESWRSILDIDAEHGVEPNKN